MNRSLIVVGPLSVCALHRTKGCCHSGRQWLGNGHCPSGAQQRARKACEGCLFCFVCQRVNANGIVHAVYTVTTYHVLGKPQWSVTVNTVVTANTPTIHHSSLFRGRWGAGCVHYPMYSKGGALCSPSGTKQQACEGCDGCTYVLFCLCVLIPFVLESVEVQSSLEE